MGGRGARVAGESGCGVRVDSRYGLRRIVVGRVFRRALRCTRSGGCGVAAGGGSHDGGSAARSAMGSSSAPWRAAKWWAKRPLRQRAVAGRSDKSWRFGVVGRERRKRRKMAKRPRPSKLSAAVLDGEASTAMLGGDAGAQWTQGGVDSVR